MTTTQRPALNFFNLFDFILTERDARGHYKVPVSNAEARRVAAQQKARDLAVYKASTKGRWA